MATFETRIVRTDFAGFGRTMELEQTYIDGKKDNQFATLMDLLKKFNGEGFQLKTHTNRVMGTGSTFDSTLPTTHWYTFERQKS